MNFDEANKGGFNVSKIVRLSAIIYWAIFVLVIAWMSIYYNSPGMIRTTQTWNTGELNTKSTNGFIFNFAVNDWEYKIQSSVKFTNKKDEENVTTKAFFVRYFDGGTGYMGGQARFTYPSDDQMKGIIRTFGSQENVTKELLIPGMREICTSTAGLMTTEESYTTKRSLISIWCEDQAQKGVYLSEIDFKTQIDDAGRKTKIAVIGIRKKNGVLQRKDPIFSQFGITCAMFKVPEISYIGGIDKKIKEKMSYRNEVQVVTSKISTQVQKLKEVTERGKKNVTIARNAQLKNKKKWVQQASAKAEKMLIDVRGDSIAAANEYTETKNLVDAAILEAEGKAERRRKEMLGDNALEKRLQTYKEVMKAWSDNIIKQKNNTSYVAARWDPNWFISLLDKIDARVRKDLGLSMKF